MNLHTPPPAHYAADIRAALDRVTQSTDFRSSPQLVAFLRVVIEMTLRGEMDRIKAYTIGTDALGRDASFDPQRDPIVRVEANRLRRALAGYYAGAGIDDPIVIEIPPGRYVPTFRLRVGDEASAEVEPAEQIRWRLRAANAGILALVLVLALAAGGWLLSQSSRRHDAPQAMPVSALAGAPIVVVGPVEAIPASRSPLAADLTGELARTLKNFPTITVMSGGDTPEGADQGGTRSAATPVYRLTGLLESYPDGGGIVSLQLVSDGMVVWTRDWRVAVDKGPSFAMIARDAGSELFSIFGVMHARLRAQSSELATGFRCLLIAADYMRKFDMTQHQRIRTCLEQTVAEDPGLATGHALLALVYEREYFVDFPPRPGEAPPLERSHEAALRALALSPDNAVVQLAMMETHYMRGEMAAAFAAGERAIALNPLDPALPGVLGMRLVLSGNMERGAPLLERSAARYGVRPGFIEFGLFCVAYLKGDMTAAAHHANLQASENYPFGMVARALVATAAGDRDRAKRLLARLAALYPSWSRPKPMLERFIRSREIVERFSRDIDGIMRP